MFDRKLSLCVQIRSCRAVVEKKSSNDIANLKNRRPVSNLPFFFKTTEKIALLQHSTSSNQ